MARIKAHQVIPVLVIGAATGIPAAATVEFLNQPSSQTGAGPASSAAPFPPTRPPATPSPSGKPAAAPSTKSVFQRRSSSSAVSSIHLPSSMSDESGGDDASGNDGAWGGGHARVRRHPTTTSTSRSAPAHGSPAVPPPNPGGRHTGALSSSFAGTAVNEPFGTVQTTITVTRGRITSVTASAPMGNQMSAAINQQAIPILRNETLQAQSANVNLVSGATVTSEAYVQSLQAALSRARI